MDRRKDSLSLLAALLVLFLGIAVVFLMTWVFTQPSLQSIGLLVTVAVIWGGVMGWNLRGCVDELRVSKE